MRNLLVRDSAAGEFQSTWAFWVLEVLTLRKDLLYRNMKVPNPCRQVQIFFSPVGGTVPTLQGRGSLLWEIVNSKTLLVLSGKVGILFDAKFP